MYTTHVDDVTDKSLCSTALERLQNPTWRREDLQQASKREREKQTNSEPSSLDWMQGRYACYAGIEI